MTGLPDYIDNNLKLLFVGYNPGERAATLGHHYAGRNNQFWRLIYEAGLTGRPYHSVEDSMLLREGYGLTNLVARPSQSSSDLTYGEMSSGAEELRNKIGRYKPAMVCFLGKDVYRRYAGLRSGFPVHYGLVTGETLFPDIMEFIAPNPSGRNTIPYTVKLSVFRELKKVLEKAAFVKG